MMILRDLPLALLLTGLLLSPAAAAQKPDIDTIITVNFEIR